MPPVLLKLLLTPIVIGGASLAGHRWGPAIGGWMVSLPLISGPVVFFLALDQGATFAAEAARGSCAGNAALAVCFLVYARVARRARWQAAAGAATLGWAVGAIALQPALAWPVAAVFVAVVAVVLVALRLMPAKTGPRPLAPAPRWEVPFRMAVGTAVVLVLTAAAPFLGAGLAGLFAMLPVITLVLSVFTQRREGAGSTTEFLRGDLAGLIGTAAFLAVVGGSIEGLGIAASFSAATVTTIVIQGVTLRALRAEAVPGLDLPRGG